MRANFDNDVDNDGDTDDIEYDDDGDGAFVMCVLSNVSNI